MFTAVVYHCAAKNCHILLMVSSPKSQSTVFYSLGLGLQEVRIVILDKVLTKILDEGGGLILAT